MSWKCACCTFKNKNTESECKMCGRHFLLKKLMTTSAFSDENELVKLIGEISRLFFPFYVSLAFIKGNYIHGKTKICNLDTGNNITNVIQIGYEAPKKKSNVGHYVLILNNRVIDLGQYAQEPIKNSFIQNVVFEEYQHFLKTMQWDRKSLGTNFGNSCLPMVLLFGVFTLKHDMELEQKAKEIQKSIQLEENAKLLQEKEDAKIAAKLEKDFRQEEKETKRLQEEEDAKIAERLAKMSFSS